MIRKKYSNIFDLNWIISNVYDLSYKIVEPFLLKYARLRHKIYDKDNLKNKISIIIATYNRAEILTKRTIPSILNQSYSNFEVVIIGDQCTDDTAEKISQINDDRIIFYNLKKRGKYPIDVENRWFVQGSKPRNYGMKIATGQWFCFITDDDILYPNHLKILLNHASKNDLEFVSAGYNAIKNGKKIIILPSKNNFRSELICGGMQTWLYRSYLKVFKWNRHSWRKKIDKPIDYDLQQRFYRSKVRMGHLTDVIFFSPAVANTNTSGYEAAILAENQ